MDENQQIILIVEDNMIAVDMICGELRVLRYEGQISTAKTLTEVMRLLPLIQEDLALIMWDGYLGRNTSPNTIRAVREILPDMTMIAMSGSEEMRVKQIKAGCNFAVEKDDIVRFIYDNMRDAIPFA